MRLWWQVDGGAAGDTAEEGGELGRFHVRWRGATVEHVGFHSAVLLLLLRGAGTGGVSHQVLRKAGEKEAAPEK